MNKAIKIEAVTDQGEAWCHLAPFGTFPRAKKGADGRITRTVQVCDRPAYEQLIAASPGEILVDYEHLSLGDHSEAAAWCIKLELREDGLWGLLRFTDKGEAAVRNRRYKFLSPVWTRTSKNRPGRLLSIGLTNTPFFELAPIANKADLATAGADADEPSGLTRDEERNPIMDIAKLIAALGLPEDAVEAQVLEAIAALQNQIEEANKQALEKEADEFVAANEEKIANKDTIREAYIANKASTIALIGAIATPKAATLEGIVTNKADARPPANPWLRNNVVANKLEHYKSLPDGAEKRQYLRDNALEINKLMNEEANNG